MSQYSIVDVDENFFRLTDNWDKHSTAASVASVQCHGQLWTMVAIDRAAVARLDFQ